MQVLQQDAKHEVVPPGTIIAGVAPLRAPNKFCPVIVTCSARDLVIRRITPSSLDYKEIVLNIIRKQTIRFLDQRINNGTRS
ncbi:hypothetical protein ACX40Y_13955 [Sphingomonas sp. RS6]